MAENSDTTNMNLTNDVTVNGQKFKAGKNVIVPKNMADNIAEIDYTHNKYLQGLHNKHTYTVDAGTIAMGGGAQ